MNNDQLAHEIDLLRTQLQAQNKGISELTKAVRELTVAVQSNQAELFDLGQTIQASKGRD